MLLNRNLLRLGVLVPVLIWIAVVYYYAVDVPWFDDFDPFPDFLRSWIDAKSFSEALGYLFQPNNEHRMVIGKLVTLFYYKLTGKLSIYFVLFSGVCFTLGTFGLFWSAFKKSNLSPYYFIPVAFLLFQIQYHLVFLWAICSMQHQAVVFFMALSMLMLSRNKFWFAVVAALLANYSMSNGIFVWAAGAGILILQSSYRNLGIWLFTAVVAVTFYFIGMSPQGNESSVDFFLAHPELSVFGFFAFLGGLVDFFPEKEIVTRSVLPVLLGVAASVWIAIWGFANIRPWLTKTFGISFRKKGLLKVADETIPGEKSLQEFLIGILLFLLANALIIGFLRPRFGFFVMIVSNYKMYPALFLIVTYLSILLSVKAATGKKIFRFGLIASVGIWAISLATYLPVIAERSKYLMVNAYNQEHNAFGLGHIAFSKTAVYVDNLMKRMTSDGIYSFPQEADWLVNEINSQNGEKLKENDVRYRVENNAIVVEDETSEYTLKRKGGQYAYLKQNAKIYLFKLAQNRYDGRNLFRQLDKGSIVEIPFSTLEKGEYELGVVRSMNDAPVGQFLGKVTIP
ncbi:hypothetical protein DSL64_12820 [Dyadobacter luteus]|jgi:hypothetical protein|uniref:Glycosyltransferase RgtA/B/C/D-like domain-containing protein n=1 Tax=Dyadobacter luteus TaxID=2259619 RepID=A0A3D8YCA4_9BACT|nr:hypothetical protein DSL64_12820 [Dyadobacter luteus]